MPRAEELRESRKLGGEDCQEKGNKVPFLQHHWRKGRSEPQLPIWGGAHPQEGMGQRGVSA